MKNLATIEGNVTSAGHLPGAGKGDLRILFNSAGGTATLQHSLDDVPANYEDALDPITGEVLAVTSTKTVAGDGRRYYRLVGSGGITSVTLQWNAHSDAG